jgi:predicted SprT family Zn-dependent metalloprotease
MTALDKNYFKTYYSEVLKPQKENFKINKYINETKEEMYCKNCSCIRDFKIHKQKFEGGITVKFFCSKCGNEFKEEEKPYKKWLRI